MTYIPSHGEGWGRPHMEAMVCGKPVIASNWSGPTEFIYDGNGYLINTTLVDTPDWKGHRWAEPSQDHLMHLMRHTFTNKEEVQETGISAYMDMYYAFSFEAMGILVEDQLRRIAAYLYKKDYVFNALTSNYTRGCYLDPMNGTVSCEPSDYDAYQALLNSEEFAEFESIDILENYSSFDGFDYNIESYYCDDTIPESEKGVAYRKHCTGSYNEYDDYDEYDEYDEYAV